MDRGWGYGDKRAESDVEGAESGVEWAETGVDGAGSGGRGGGIGGGEPGKIGREIDFFIENSKKMAHWLDSSLNLFTVLQRTETVEKTRLSS